MGRVSQVKQGRDGAIREVELMTSSKRKIRRPVNLLIPLEVQDSANDQDSANEFGDNPKDIQDSANPEHNEPTLLSKGKDPSATTHNYNLRPRPTRPKIIDAIATTSSSQRNKAFKIHVEGSGDDGPQRALLERRRRPQRMLQLLTRCTVDGTMQIRKEDFGGGHLRPGFLCHTMLAERNRIIATIQLQLGTAIHQLLNILWIQFKLLCNRGSPEIYWKTFNGFCDVTRREQHYLQYYPMAGFEPHNGRGHRMVQNAAPRHTYPGCGSTTVVLLSSNRRVPPRAVCAEDHLYVFMLPPKNALTKISNASADRKRFATYHA
uniref:Fe2OG dioxygenase domain-containing protein n=1 Tax=Haemonchus contortus TaxID=6289 RepID=A0A7I4XT24_HAECO